MPPPLPELYADGGATLLGSFAFTQGGAAVDSGGTSDVIAFELWNDKGGGASDPMTGVSLNFLGSPHGLEQWSAEHRSLVEYWIQVRAVGVEGDATPYISSWEPVGVGRPFLMPPIPANSARLLEAQVVTPIGSTSEALDYLASVDYARLSLAVARGLFNLGGQGIDNGLGDGTRTYIAEGGALSASVVPDDKVHVTDVVAVVEGVPVVVLEHDETLSGDAADGALVAGEDYWAAITLGPDGIVVTKGNGGASPQSTTAQPALPVGHKHTLLGYVRREFDGTVEAEDVYVDGLTLGNFALGGTGLERTVGSGVAIVDDRIVRYESSREAPIPADTDPFAVWIPPAGDPVVNEDVRPDARALILWSGATDSDEVTELVDQRQVLGRLDPVRFVFSGAAIAVNDARYATWPIGRRSYLSLPAPVALVLHDVGAGTGGRLAFEVEYWDGAAWTSLFTGSGTEDRRPAIDFPATERASTAAVPEVRTFGPYAQLRARCVEIPSGGAAPTNVEVLLFPQAPR
jgi:hypothetical protein